VGLGAVGPGTLEIIEGGCAYAVGGGTAGEMEGGGADGLGVRNV